MEGQERATHFLAVSLACALLFLLVFHAHYANPMPFHADSWLLISIADEIIDSGEVTFQSPFGDGGLLIYPRGSHLYTAVFGTVCGLRLADVSILLPPLLYVGLGGLFYALGRRLYESREAALCVLAATPFAVSNYTLLGPSYLVPVAFGSLLMVTYFYFLIAAKYQDIRFAGVALLVFIVLANTHVNSTLLAIAATFLFVFFSLLFDHRVREDIVLLGVGVACVLGAAGIAVSAFGVDRVFGFLSTYLFLEKEKPYQDYVALVGLVPALLAAAAVYYISFHGKRRALTLLVPVFAFLVAESIAYWLASGVFIRYRRVVYFMLLLTPLIAGYGLWGVLSSLSGFLREQGYERTAKAAVIIGVTVVVALGASTHLATYDNVELYVSPADDKVLATFGAASPDSFLFAHHLTSFSLPYYDLMPLQLSPRHAGPKFRYESGLYRIYPDGDLGEFASFFLWLDGMHGSGTFDWLDRHPESGYYLYLPRHPRSTPDFDVVVDAGEKAVLRYNNGIAKKAPSYD